MKMSILMVVVVVCVCMCVFVCVCVYACVFSNFWQEFHRLHPTSLPKTKVQRNLQGDSAHWIVVA